MFDVKVDCMVNIHSIITYIGATQPWPKQMKITTVSKAFGRTGSASKVSTYKAWLSWIC